MGEKSEAEESTLQKRRLPISLSAGVLTQFLSAFACFLAAYVLPAQFRDLRGHTQWLLLGLGGLFLLVGLLNLFFGHHVLALLARAGIRSRVVIPREGMVYLGMMLTLAVGALLGQHNQLLLIFGLLAGPFVLSGWMVYVMLKGVTAERILPPEAAAGQFMTVEVLVKNGKNRLASRMLDIRDVIRPIGRRTKLKQMEAAITFVRVPAGESRWGRYQVRFDQRGRYRFGPLRVSSRFPLGIIERGQVESRVQQMIVHPRTGVLTADWQRRLQHLAESASRARGRAGMFDDEFSGIREYREGDNVRSVHWRSTARTGRPMIREFEQHRRAELCVILDLFADDSVSADDTEAMVSLAATVLSEQTKHSSSGDFALIVAARETEIVSGRIASEFRRSAMDVLAGAESSDAADLGAAVISAAEQGQLARGLGVLITPRPQLCHLILPELSAALFPDSSDLLSRFAVVQGTAENISTLLDTESESESPRISQSSGSAAPDRPPARAKTERSLAAEAVS